MQAAHRRRAPGGRRAAELPDSTTREAKQPARWEARRLAVPSASAPQAHTAPVESVFSALRIPIVQRPLCPVASPLDTAASRASIRRIVGAVSPATPWPTAACKLVWMTTVALPAPTAAMSDGRFATSATKTESAPTPPSAVCARVTAADACSVAKKLIAPADTAINSLATASSVGMAGTARPRFAIP